MPTLASVGMLKALNNVIRSGSLKMYEGTAHPPKVAKSRAANKVARKQRAVNRQNGSGR